MPWSRERALIGWRGKGPYGRVAVWEGRTYKGWCGGVGFRLCGTDGGVNCALALVKFSSARNGFGVSQISSVEMSMHECIHANALTDPGSCRPTQTRSTTSFPSRPAPRRTKICFPPHKNFPQKYFRSTKTFHRTTQQRKKEKKKREKNSECLNCSNQ